MLTVSNLLGALQEDPYKEQTIVDLRDALASGDPAILGESPVRLIAIAREQHESRHESAAAAGLLSIEIDNTKDDVDRRAALLVRLGRLHREELLDDESAKVAYKAALALRPGDPDIEEVVEQIESAESNWKDIAKRFVDEADTTSEPSLKTSLLVSAAMLVWKYKKKGRDKDVDRLFKQALESDPGDARAARLQALTLRKREKFDLLAATLLEAGERTKQREDRLFFYRQAARTCARVLEQKDRAAACYERVLDFAPGDDEAMNFLVEHFTDKEAWDHLVALYDDALRSRHKLENELGIVLQIAMVHWRFREAPAEAEPYFARLRKVDPTHKGMIAFYREYLPAIGDHAKLVTVLTDAQRVAADPKQKLDLAVELAKAAASSGATDRAIDAWKSVQRIDPHHAEALPALHALYRAGGKWNALVEILKNEIEALPEGDNEKKVALLRETIPIYQNELKLDVMVINTWNAILAIHPDDQEALDSLATTFETMGRWNDLIQVLTKKADAVDDPIQQAGIYMRVAKLWIDRFANYNQATRPLEQVIEKDPTHREALMLLKDIYTKKRSWKQLYDVLRAESELASDPDVRQAHRVELAKIAGERLHRAADAITMWKDVLANDPGNEEALESLEKLADREKDWATVADVIERRVSNPRTDDKERIKLLTKLGTLYGEQMNDAPKAASAWKRVLALDPKNGRALRTLREAYVSASDWASLEALYGEANDWDGLAEVFGNAAEKAETPALRVDLSFRAAAVYENNLKQPHRAFRSYERALATDPKNDRAARALLPIYEKEEKWGRVPALSEVILGNLAGEGDATRAERLTILERLRKLASDRLNDPQAALRWAIQAFEIDPTGESTRTTLFSTAEKIGSEKSTQWADVEKALTARLANAATPAEGRWLRAQIAAVAGDRLGQTDRAVEQLRAMLASDPKDADAATSLDRVLRGAGRHQELRGLYTHRIEHAADDTERWMLVSEQARHEETELGDKNAAATLYRRALELDAKDGDALTALDRLASEGGRHEELVSVLEKRRTLAASDAERTDLTLRLGETLAGPLAQPERAKDELAKVLEARPGDARAISTLEGIAASKPELVDAVGRVLEPSYEATGAWDKLRDVLQTRMTTSQDVDERRTLRLRFADLSTERANDPNAAYAVIEGAFLDDPKDASLWDRLEQSADRAGKQADAAAAMATAIEESGLAAQDQAALSKRVAAIYSDVLGRAEEAEPFHKRVLAFDPADEASFNSLKELYTERERWNELQTLYRTRIAQTVDADSKLDLLLQLCFLFEELIDDPNAAIAAYRDVLELEPRHVAARRALDRLYLRTERFADLAELLRGDLDQQDGDEATATMVRLGEVLETKLAMPKDAVDQYEAAINKSPDHEGARAALERLMSAPSQRQRVAAILEPVHEMRESHADLARVLEVQLEAQEDKGNRVALLQRIGLIHQTKLDDADGTFRAYARAVQLDPADAGLRSELATAAARHGAHAERAEVLELALATAGNDGALKRELGHEIARIWDDMLGDSVRAETAYARLIEHAEGDADTILEASRALERIHVANGDHAKLAIDLRRQAELENDPEAKRQLLVRLGDLVEERLGDRSQAIAIQEERLANDPTDADALRALERLYEAAGNWAALAGVLEKLDVVAANDEERKTLARRIGAIRDTKLQDRDGAIQAYNDVVQRFGPDRESLTALIRLYEAAERYTDLLEVVLMVRDLMGDGAARAGLTFHAAELMRTQTNEIERSIEAYQEVLEVDAHHEGALNALHDIAVDPESSERLAAARALRPRYESSGNFPALLEVLEVLATGEDPAERLSALRRAAEIAEGPLGEAGKAFDFAMRAARLAVTEPEIGPLLADGERLAASSDRWLDYATNLMEIAPDIGDAELQVDAYRKIATIAESRLADTETARQYYEKVLAERGDDRPAFEALERIASGGEKWAALHELLVRKSDSAVGPEERVQLLLRRAELAETRLNDVPGAIDTYDSVLSESESLPAYQGLERLYQKAERWPDLAALYERMLERNVGFDVDVRYKLGRLYRERLGDPFLALEQFREALSGGAPHEPTIEQLEQLMASGDHRSAAATVLEPIYQQRLQWAKVEGALEARLSGEGDLEVRKGLLERLGRLREEYLEDLDGALGLYARLFREDPRDESTWDTLARLAKALDAWPRVADIYKTTLDEIGVDDVETAKLATIAAQMFEQRPASSGQPDLDKSAELYKKALAFAPTDRGVFLALESLYQRQKNWGALLELYRSQIDVAENDGERVSLLEKSAITLRDETRNADEAIDVFREILDIDPQHPGANDAVDALLTERSRWSDLAEHLRHRIQYASGAQETQLRQRLGTLLAEKLDDRVLAVDTFEEIARQNPEHAESVAALEKLITDPAHQARIIEILEPIYQATDQWRKRIAIQEAKAGLTEEPSEKAAILSEVGHLHEDRGRDLAMAFDAQSRAMALEPGNEAHRAEVDRLAGQLSAYDPLVAAYENAIKASTDPVVTTSLLNTVARVHDEKRGDPRAAIETYERLLAHDTSDASPLDALEALHTMVGDWRGMVSVLERKVDRAYDPAERGELLRRAGSVAEDLLGDRNQAIALYKKASEEDSNDPVALESLDRLYSEAADHEHLGEVLKRRLEIETDLEARVDVGLRLGALSRDALRDPEGAIEAYARVISDREGEPTAVAALTELYERQARWPDLLENLRLRAGLSPDPAARVAFLHRSANVLERELDDVPEALIVHEQVLAIDPRHEPSIQALVRIAKLDEHRSAASTIVLPILEREGRYTELSQLLGLVAEASRDPGERKETLRRLARVHESGLKDLSAAFDAENRALAEDPSDDEVASSLESLAGRLGSYDKLADALAARASSASDPDAARNLYARLARVAEGNLNDDARAIEAHKRTLENANDDRDALSALDRLYTKQSDWNALADVLDRRVQNADDPTERRDLLVRLGSLRWEHFEDVRSAFSAFSEVLEREPDEPRALGAIEGLLADETMAPQVVETLDQAYRATGSTAKVASLYEVRARIADSDGERVRLLTELAQLQETELHDYNAALNAATRAYELDPRDEALLGEVERLAGASGSFQTLAGLAERIGDKDVLDRTMKRDLALRAAGWYRDRIGDVAAAEGRLRAALDADRESGEAHAQLVELLRASGRQATLVAALRAWAEVEFDEDARKERLRESAHLAESLLGDIGLAADSLERILATDGADTHALDELVRIRMAEGKWSAVASLLEKRIDAESAPEKRVTLRRQLAQTYQGPLGDDAHAIESWQAVVDEAPTDLDAIGALETLFEKGQKWRDLEELVQRRLDIAETQADRIAARVRLARLVERLGRRSEAAEQLHEILGEDPNNVEALDELERLYAADKKWDELSELMRRRIDDAASRGDATAEVTGLSRLAELEETQLGQPEAAIATWERTVERDPSHLSALSALARLYAAAGRHAEAADTVTRRIALLPTAAAIHESYALAELADTKLGDAARTEQALRGAFELDRTDAETRKRLKAFYEKTNNHQALADMLALDLDASAENVGSASPSTPAAEKAAKIALLKRIADLYSQKLGDPGSAARYFEQAAALDPENREVLLPLCDLYIAAGRSADAVPVLEKIIASYGTKRSKEVAVYQHRLGQALEGLGQTAQALAAYDAAFKIDLTSVAILRDLGRLCYTTGDFDRAQKTFRALLLQKLDPNGGITKGDVYFYLGDISAKQGDPKKGIQMLERAVQEEAGHPRATALLAQLKAG